MTNGEINRLGQSICNKNGKLDNTELDLLQRFRISFSEPLVDTYNIVRSLSDKVHRASITAFRLKRIGTIINKIERQPKMALSRMGDIAGIRCIFYNENEVYKALALIKTKFIISGKIRDYIENPKELGYKGIHIYVIEPKSEKRIEIQLRTIEFHNWATLVEITDLLYGLRLKELGSNSDKEFAKFHSLMSSEKELNKEEADLIYNVLKKRNFISKLSSTFRKNNNEVKKRWSSKDSKNSFFLIEASKDSIPSLQSFKTFEDAETAYFKKYKQNENAEIVLTSIKKPNFNQISIAYANYILSYHTFMNDIKPILQELALEALENKKYFRFKKIFKTYEDLQANVLFEVLMESTDLFLNKLGRKKMLVGRKNRLTRLQENEIRNKIEQKIKQHQKSHREFLQEVELYLPKNFIIRELITDFLKKHNKRIKKIMIGNQLEFEELLSNS
jgi:ppGpp synthetase/RelA/SpoT-type nucleotidyltranferase